MFTILGLCLFSVSVQAMYLGQNWGRILEAERLEQPRCVNIPRNFTLCHGIQYNSMRLPNLLDHESLDEAIQQSDAWNSLLSLHCHADTQLFLCSLFAPVCVPEMEKAIYPCQSLCKDVQRGCESRMLQYGFSWPESLDCSRYPIDNDLCIKRPVEQQQSQEGSGNSHSRMFSTKQVVSTPFTTTTSFPIKSQSDSLNKIDASVIPYAHPTTNTSAVNNSLAPMEKTTKNASISDAKRECQACRQPPTYENIIDNYCSSNIVFKAKVRQHNSTHLAIQRVQRVFKPPASSHHQVGRLVKITDDLDCHCLTSSDGKNKMAGNYLIMSQHVNQQPMRLILPWQQKDKAFKNAIRKFRRINCGALGREIRESVLKHSRKQQQFK